MVRNKANTRANTSKTDHRSLHTRNTEKVTLIPPLMELTESENNDFFVLCSLFFVWNDNRIVGHPLSVFQLLHL